MVHPTVPVLPNVSTSQLAYLVAITRHRTWAEAASSLGVTPSALSQGIAELERRLGVPLFAADGRRRVAARAHGNGGRRAPSGCWPTWSR